MEMLKHYCCKILAQHASFIGNLSSQVLFMKRPKHFEEKKNRKMGSRQLLFFHYNRGQLASTYKERYTSTYKQPLLLFSIIFYTSWNFQFLKDKKKGRRIACSSSGIFWSKKIVSILLFLSYFLDKIGAQRIFPFTNIRLSIFQAFFPPKVSKVQDFNIEREQQISNNTTKHKMVKANGSGGR